MNNSETSFIENLTEIRKRLIISLIVIFVIFIGLFAYSDLIFNIIAEPWLSLLSVNNGQIIATSVTSSFFAPMKLSFYLSIFLALPVLCWQLWSFLAPGLFPNERNTLWFFFSASLSLAYLGALFCFFVVLPMCFYFFSHAAPETVRLMTDINAYLDFILTLILAFSFTFQLPMVLTVGLRKGIISLETLSQSRPYIIIGSFILGMLLTPPDIFSQTLLALPIWLLFELTLFIHIRFSRRQTLSKKANRSEKTT